ncbi:hypothetical protein EV187_3450 [Agromyces ramosus]|uniref:Uncharacterized protein n=1 Tax=Agromyces ramosus TaxID=33879 RepID=A0A4Q7M742_9MICO|nr:hypothetical protein [Agromyces ramosus]RZS63544.1 hypothetical protein EV187_3450 [Agromyces ramosus]
MRVGEGDFLLGLAGVSATMLGTFIVGVFFYIESGLHRRMSGSVAADRYLRSGMRWVFAAYSLPLLVALVLAALDPIWGTLTFIVLGLVLVLTSIDTGRRILMQGGSGLSRAPLINEWLTNAAVLVAVVLPWLIGGWVPEPSAFIPSLLIVLAAGFASTVALIMAEFDATMAVTESPDRKPVDPGR